MHQMKIQIERSVRHYDRAILVWHRKLLVPAMTVADSEGYYRPMPEQYGPWYIVGVRHEEPTDA